MMLKNIMLLLLSLTILGCGDDNDDIILENDVSNIVFDQNIDPNAGITFGMIDPAFPATNVVYKYTSQGLFLSDNANTVVSEKVWTFFDCPFSEASLSSITSEGVPNVARGVRDVVSNDIIEIFNSGVPFFILEYYVANERRTLQFTINNKFNEEQVDTYFSYIIETIGIIDFSADPLLIFDPTTGLCI